MGPWKIIGGHCEKYPHSQHYRQTSRISRNLVSNKIVDHSDVVGASPVGAANYIFILDLTHGFNGLGKDICKTRRDTCKCWDWVRFILEVWPYVVCYSFKIRLMNSLIMALAVSRAKLQNHTVDTNKFAFYIVPVNQIFDRWRKYSFSSSMSYQVFNMGALLCAMKSCCQLASVALVALNKCGSSCIPKPANNLQ